MFGWYLVKSDLDFNIGIITVYSQHNAEPTVQANTYNASIKIVA